MSCGHPDSMFEGNLLGRPSFPESLWIFDAKSKLIEMDVNGMYSIWYLLQTLSFAHATINLTIVLTPRESDVTIGGISGSFGVEKPRVLEHTWSTPSG